MAYQIIQSNNAELTMTSTNSIMMDSDNIVLDHSSYGSEHVNDWNMELVDLSNYWTVVDSSATAERYYYQDSIWCCHITLVTTGGWAGIQQSTLASNLIPGRKYRVSVIFYGVTLLEGQINIHINGVEIFQAGVSNGKWVTLEADFIATIANPTIQVFVDNNQAGSEYYIQSFSIKEILDGNLAVNGSFSAGNHITGNALTPNFVPALFGIHWTASAAITYTGGSTGNLPSQIIWTCTGKETVTQTIHYDQCDRPDVITTVGSDFQRTVTETLHWDSNGNLDNYGISF